MGKTPLYMDTDTDDHTSSSFDTMKKKKKSSILKHPSNTTKKKKCKIHSKSEPEDSEYSVSSVRSNRPQKKPILRGILKHTREYSSSEEDDRDLYAQSRQTSCLVGRVPGGRPGYARGGGVALIVRKNLGAADNSPRCIVGSCAGAYAGEGSFTNSSSRRRSRA